jgi:Glycosyl hydrolase family 99
MIHTTDPWYPETWTVNGAMAHFLPSNGAYSSSDPVVIEDHIDQLEYANVEMGIASWWGQGEQLDLARISLLMDKTTQMQSGIKWTVYYEPEYHVDASSATIKNDLDYIKKWYAWHNTWAHIDSRPVIFVYNEAGCEVANRWSAASNGEWYVVLKLFPGYNDCPVQPDSWHQYGPANAVVSYPGVSHSVSPGFWRADSGTPLLRRVSEQDWRTNVRDMVSSGAPWQLVTTFNEAGEGTMIESSPHWSSNTGYGYYLDALNQIS